MTVKTDKPEQGGVASAAPRGSAPNPRPTQLKGQLRGADFAAGAALLAPEVQMKGGGGTGGKADKPGAADEPKGLDADKNHQAQSWARTHPGPGGVAGAIYFPTKGMNLDAADEARIKEIAKAYAPWAKRNLGKAGAELGLKGSVVGYADPRKSKDPDNAALAEGRAAIVARMLTRSLAYESHLAEGDFDIKPSSGGAEVIPDGPAIEASNLALMRRADITLEGEILAPKEDAPKPAAPEEKDDGPKPPTIGKEYDDWDRYAGWDEMANPKLIYDEALSILARLVSQSYVGDVLRDTSLASIAIDIRRGGPSDAGTLPFKARKPPWWDARGRAFTPRGSRGGVKPIDNALYKMKLLRRDAKETMFLMETEFSAKSGAYIQWMEEYRTGDPPNPAVLKKHAETIGYLMFEIDETGDLAEEVMKLAQALKKK